MSTALSPAVSPDRVAAPRPERHLRPVEATGRRRRPTLVYALTAVIGAIVIGGAQMGFSIATTQTTYQIRQLTDDKRALKLEGQQLYDEVAGLSSPQYLASNAASLGMVVGGSPTYLRLSDGAIVGESTAGTDSSVDARRAAVANELVSDIPLVTSPSQTISGAAGAQQTTEKSTSIDALPTPQQAQVPVDDASAEDTTAADAGIPMPQTH